MRNVVYGINISINGCCDHTKFGPDKETFEFFINLIKEADLIVYGRKTYELMVPYWPDIAKAKSETKVENDFAETFTAIDKVVFSKTLQSADENTRIVRDNLEEEILKLKQQPGKKISVGGVDLPGQLMALGLIDEYYFVVHPVVVGEGRKLWDDVSLTENRNLKLVDCKVFKSGCLALHYLKQ
jgi:dihydrofolate reductase